MHIHIEHYFKRKEKLIMRKKQNKIIFQEENKFNKPNILIHIVNQRSLSLKSKRIYNIFLRHLLDQNEEAYSTRFIEITISHLLKELGVEHRAEMEELLNELQTQVISFDHKIKESVKVVSTQLIQDYYIDKKNQHSIKVYFSEFLTKEIIKYNDKYTKLDLIEYNNIKVSHALTLYELFKSKICKFKVQFQNYTELELRKKLGLEDTYTDIKTFNQDVIRKSIKDINKSLSLRVELLKIHRANTKDNPTQDRIYKFRIKQDLSKLIYFTQFRNLLRKDIRISEPIAYKLGAHTYELQSDNTMLMNDKNHKKYWLRESGQKTTTLISKKIWAALYSEFTKDFTRFIKKYDLNL